METRRYIDIHGKNRKEYLRVCSCGNEKWVRSVPKETTCCADCNGKKLGYKMSQLNIKEDKDFIRYTRVCPCGDVRHDLKAKPREGALCTTCSRKKPKELGDNVPSRITITRDNGGIRTLYYRVCANKECGEEAYVSFKPKPGAFCQACARRVSHSMKGKIVKRPAGNKPRTKKNKPRKKAVTSKTVSTAAIERQREINRKHREEVKQPKKKAFVQNKSDEELIAEFMKNKTVTVIEPSYRYFA